MEDGELMKGTVVMERIKSSKHAQQKFETIGK